MSTLKLDNLYTHSKNVGPTYSHDGLFAEDVLGTFCGTPIVALDERAVDVDLLVEIGRTIEANKVSAQGNTAEVLPGELVCTDGIVRRETSAEAVGYDRFYAYESPKGTTKVSIPVARKYQGEDVIEWRPDHVVGTEEFALLYTQEAQ
jgi:hypothetical protein